MTKVVEKRVRSKEAKISRLLKIRSARWHELERLGAKEVTEDGQMEYRALLAVISHVEEDLMDIMGDDYWDFGQRPATITPKTIRRKIL